MGRLRGKYLHALREQRVVRLRGALEVLWSELDVRATKAGLTSYLQATVLGVPAQAGEAWVADVQQRRLRCRGGARGRVQDMLGLQGRLVLPPGVPARSLARAQGRLQSRQARGGAGCSAGPGGG